MIEDLGADSLDAVELVMAVEEEFGKVVQQRPINPCPDFCRDFDGIPANAGTFESSFDILSLSLTTRI